jgi:hypothetical protein
MEKEVKIHVKQREHLADLLSQAKRREEQQLEQSSPVSEESIARELLIEEEGDKLLRQIDTAALQISELQDALNQAERDLHKLGFERKGSSISLHWDAPDVLRRIFRERLAQSKGAIEKSLKKYDSAITSVWVATSSQDLQNAIANLL